MTTRAVILRTKDELDAEEFRRRQYDAMLSSFGHFRTLAPLDQWKNDYVTGAIDFETFERGLAERVR